MYKSPIDVFTSQVDNAIKQMREQQEEQILQAVLNVGVNVDKDELIRALKNDREQYKKGHADGVKEFAEVYADHIRGIIKNHGNYYVSLESVLHAVENVYEKLGRRV